MPDSWNWIAEHETLTGQDLRDDDRFNNKVVEELLAGEGANNDGPFGRPIAEKEIIDGQVMDTKELPPEERLFDIYTIYNLNTDTFFTIANNGLRPLIEEQPTPVGTDKYPFNFLRFTLRDNSPYPIPPISQAIDPQFEFNNVRSKIMVHRKRFNRKYEVNINAFEDADTEIAKLEAGTDGTILRKQMGERAVEPIQDAPLDQMSIVETSALNRDIVDVFGTPDEARGIGSSDSATEALVIDKRLQIREGDRLSQVIDWIKDWARRMDRLVQTHINEEEAIRIIGPEGEFWIVVTPQAYQDLDGEYEYSVNVGAKTPQLPQAERQQWLALMQVVLQYPVILTKPRIMKQIAEMHGIEDETMIEEFRQAGLEMLQLQQQAAANKGAEGS